MTCKGTLRQVFICLRPRTPYPPYTLCMYPCIQYTLFTQGGGGGVNQRGGERGNRSQSWLENTNMTECTQEIGYLQSINSEKHLPQSPFRGLFYDNDILH
jgi:hypothetical protein